MDNRYAEDVETSFADTIVAAHREKIEKEYIAYFVDLPTALKPPPPPPLQPPNSVLFVIKATCRRYDSAMIL